MYRQVSPPDAGNIKRVVILLVVVFAVTLAVVVGARLSSDAIAVLVGVIAGVAASIPTALLLMAVTRRREPRRPEPYEEQQRMNPPVIVVAPGNAPQVLPQYAGMYAQQSPATQGRRKFRVMGYDEEDLEPLEGEAESPAWYQ